MNDSRFPDINDDYEFNQILEHRELLKELEILEKFEQEQIVEEEFKKFTKKLENTFLLLIDKNRIEYKIYEWWDVYNYTLEEQIKYQYSDEFSDKDFILTYMGRKMDEDDDMCDENVILNTVFKGLKLNDITTYWKIEITE